MCNKDLVLIKYGGGLITSKAKLCEANYSHINGLSEAVERLLGASLPKHNYHVVVIHGAGGFGHLKAKKYQLHLGEIKDKEKEQKQGNLFDKVPND